MSRMRLAVSALEDLEIADGFGFAELPPVFFSLMGIMINLASAFRPPHPTPPLDGGGGGVRGDYYLAYHHMVGIYLFANVPDELNNNQRHSVPHESELLLC